MSANRLLLVGLAAFAAAVGWVIYRQRTARTGADRTNEDLLADSLAPDDLGPVVINSRPFSVEAPRVPGLPTPPSVLDRVSVFLR